jgi:transposase
MADHTDPVTAGLDLGDRKTFVVVMDPARKVTARVKIDTTHGGFASLFEDQDPVRVVLEVGTHSRWISALLKSFGHEVLVVDPRKLPRNPSEDKNDWKDAEHLARVGQRMPELFHLVHHRDDETHADLLVLKARSVLVEIRTKLINATRGFVKSTGKERLPRCDSRSFVRRAAEKVPPDLEPVCGPLMEIIEAVNGQIRGLDRKIEELATERYPETATMTQVTGVANYTALAVMLTIGDKHRFPVSRDVGSYFGLRPRLRESGSLEPQLRITKAGDPFVRRLLVTSAHYILGPLCKTDSSLRRWGLSYCERGGKNAKKRAVVAVARKLSVVLHRLWMTGEVYEPLRGWPREVPKGQPA